MCKRDYIWSPATCNCENGKYLASIIDDSVTTSDEIKKQKLLEQKQFQQKLFHQILTKKVNFITKKFYILVTFL